MRAVHAGHTPHPTKSRHPHPASSPMLAQSIVKGALSAIPAHMQQAGTPAATLQSFHHPAGGTPYPSSLRPPLDDTPVPRTGMMSQTPAALVPDSCLGQVCLADARCDCSMHDQLCCSVLPVLCCGMLCCAVLPVSCCAVGLGLSYAMLHDVLLCSALSC